MHLGLGEIRGGRLRELHHEHGTRREVGCVEQACARGRDRRQLVQGLVGKARRSHHAVHAGRQGRAQVGLHHGGLREVHEDVEVRACKRFGHGGEHGHVPAPFSLRVYAADELQVLRRAHRVGDRRAHAPRASRNRHLDHGFLPFDPSFRHPTTQARASAQTLPQRHRRRSQAAGRGTGGGSVSRPPAVGIRPGFCLPSGARRRTPKARSARRHAPADWPLCGFSNAFRKTEGRLRGPP